MHHVFEQLVCSKLHQWIQVPLVNGLLRRKAVPNGLGEGTFEQHRENHHSCSSWIRSYVLCWEVVGKQQCMEDEEKAGEGKNGQWVIPEMGRAEGTSRSIIIIIIIIAKGPLRQQKAEGTPTRIFTIMLHNRWVTWNCRKVHNMQCMVLLSFSTI